MRHRLDGDHDVIETGGSPTHENPPPFLGEGLQHALGELRPLLRHGHQLRLVVLGEVQKRSLGERGVLLSEWLCVRRWRRTHEKHGERAREQEGVIVIGSGELQGQRSVLVVEEGVGVVQEGEAWQVEGGEERDGVAKERLEWRGALRGHGLQAAAVGEERGEERLRGREGGPVEKRELA